MNERAKARRQNVNQSMKRLSPRRSESETSGYFGAKKGIIILVNFKDKAFDSSHDNALFQDIANQENYTTGNFKGSLYDYFLAQSEGKFHLTFDVVGPVTVSNNYSYYGKNDSQGNDMYPGKMVIEALNLVNSEVNFADYDWDNDGFVDQVFIVYAGKGEANGGNTNTIWPHAYTLYEAGMYGDGTGIQTLDGVKINTYACGSELNGSGEIDGIGTMCHEFSHCLGYPDFYDTDYSGGQGMSSWDLMDGGCYNDNGFRPAGYTAYERWVAGWKTPIELVYNQRVDSMKALQDGGDAYIIYNKGHRDEYYILENRQKIAWDTDLPGKNMLIVHVDYNATDWANNQPNDNPSHQRMTWIPADNNYSNYSLSNDTYPSGSNNAFGKNTTPAAILYNNNIDGTKYLDSSVEQIKRNSDGTMSFVFKGLSIVQTPTFSPKAGRYEEAQTVSISCETEGAIIYYTTDGSAPSANSMVYDTPLTISETTTIKAVAIKDGEESDIATAKFTIGASTSNPDLKTFKLVTSTADMEAGMRYIIACGSKSKAAGALNNQILKSESVTADDNIITITDNVSVFIAEETDNGWSFQAEDSNEFLYATATKKLAYGTDPASWNLSDGTTGVIMAYGSYGTMLYNATSPRFTVYTSDPTSSMIQANLYMEYDNGSTLIADPQINADSQISFLTAVGTQQTKTINVHSEGLKEDITVTLNDADNVFTLNTPTIDKSETNATVSISFIPQAVGTYSGTVTLSSTGAEDVTVTLNATAIEAPEPTTDDRYEVVADATTLTSGEQMLITCTYDNDIYAMSTTQKMNNRAATKVVMNADGTIMPNDDVQVITLEKEENGYCLFNVGDGYLYAASSSANTLKTETTPDDNAKATIDIDDNNVVTITFQGSNTRNTIRFNYNNGSPIFSCYGENSTQILPQLYRKVDDTTTGIADVKSMTGSQKQVYNLNGQRIDTQSRKGIYIINGRKVVVR